MKLTEYNFRATRQTFTVSRIVEDNIDIHSKTYQKDIETEEPEHSTHVATGKSKKKVEDLELEEPTNKKSDKRQRYRN